jgi:hypothetical protein
MKGFGPLHRNPKSYRKALDAIREQGPDNVTDILQSQMVKPGEKSYR